MNLQFVKPSSGGLPLRHHTIEKQQISSESSYSIHHRDSIDLEEHGGKKQVLLDRPQLASRVLGEAQQIY
uniref:Uncharacterized protein n=1 Tax=Arundo donax TaxID=35708 RepID=A0A0A9CW90_ARUDO